MSTSIWTFAILLVLISSIGICHTYSSDFEKKLGKHGIENPFYPDSCKSTCPENSPESHEIMVKSGHDCPQKLNYNDGNGADLLMVFDLWDICLDQVCKVPAWNPGFKSIFHMEARL